MVPIMTGRRDTRWNLKGPWRNAEIWLYWKGHHCNPGRSGENWCIFSSWIQLLNWQEGDRTYPAGLWTDRFWYTLAVLYTGWLISVQANWFWYGLTSFSTDLTGLIRPNWFWYAWPVLLEVYQICYRLTGKHGLTSLSTGWLVWYELTAVRVWLTRFGRADQF